MKKIFSLSLMAMVLLISGNLWANLPQRPTPPMEPKGFQMNSDIDGRVKKAPMRRLAQNEESQVRLTYGSFDQTFTGDRALQDAFDALPANSTPAFVTLLTDVNVPTTKTTVTMAQYHNVTLDLNGHNVYGATNVTGSAAVITNNGTLTIEDKVGGGSISNLEENPEDYKAAGKTYPSYAYNVISNNGTLIINGGYFVNYTSSSSSYVVDNNSSARSAKFIMNGGTLENQATNAIRQFCNSTTHKNDVIINDGLVYGYCPIWMQSPNNNKNVGSLTINGGEIRSHANCYVRDHTCSLKETQDYIYNYGTSSSQDYSAMSITITGGTFNVNLNTYGNIKTRVSGGVFNANFKASTTDTQLSGGEFYFDASETESYSGYGYQAEQYYPDYDADYLRELGYSFKEDLEGQGYTVMDYCEYSPANDCGKWWACFASAYSEFYYDKKGWIADGYCTKRIGIEPDRTVLVSLCSKDTAAISGDMNAEDLKDEKSEPIELTETTDLIINNTGENAKITFNEDATVNKITVTSEDGAPGEAQIVVGTGVVLNVGNGGIVSENDILTTVLVKDGGTLIIGKNGVEQDGEATPIEIKTSEENGSGTLIFSPSAKQEDTKKYAEVDLYTYCKKIGEGKYTWQQFAIPVTDLTNDKVVKTPNKTSYVFKWDYATYGWSQLNNWNQVNVPFAGYDVTNISENGGVVYTFKGNLIGNQNIQLTLPHKDYCVMGNSYTAPISIEALFEQISKEMDQSEEGTIEKTVYKYDAKAGYYVYTNELEQTLAKLGIMKASFTDIKPMEGFLLNLQNGNTAGVMLNYASAVFTPATKVATPASAPARKAATTDMTIAKMTINSANYTDRMTLVEGEEFSVEIENGKDAYKYMNEDGINFYAFNNNDKLAMLASDNIDGTNIAFQSAADDEYTLTFQNIINNNYELLDMQTGIRVPMIEGNVYTFSATPNTFNPSRFMVVSARTTPTGSEQVKAVKNVKGIYTMLGQYMGEAEVWSSLPQGVYVVNGINMVK